MRWVLLVTVLTSAAPDAAAAESLTRQWAWCRDHDPDRLIRGCSAVIGSRQETPDNLAKAFFNRGRAWSDKGEFDRAIRDFDNATRLDPNYPDALNSRALAYAGKGDFNRAIQDLDEAIRLDPNFAIAIYNRGLAFQNLGRPDEAAKEFARAKQVGPRLTPSKE